MPAERRWHPSGMRSRQRTTTGGIASLNHRLMAENPPGSTARSGQPTRLRTDHRRLTDLPAKLRLRPRIERDSPDRLHQRAAKQTVPHVVIRFANECFVHCSICRWMIWTCLVLTRVVRHCDESVFFATRSHMKATSLRTVAVLGFSVVGTAGCGTINNMIVGTPPAVGTCEPSLEVYGGVRSDLRDVLQLLTPPYSESPVENIGRTVGAGGALVDVPLSAIADTLTLGKTIPAAIKRKREAP